MVGEDSTSWQERYADKVMDAERAVACVQAGQRVFIGSGAAEPQTLVEALSARQDVADTEIVHILTLGVATYAEPRFGEQFRHNAYFVGPNVREAVAQGRADYTPVFLSEIPRLFRSGRVTIDVALIEVSPPDKNGLCSYSVSTDIVKAAAESARQVIAEVNEQAPRARATASFTWITSTPWCPPTGRSSKLFRARRTSYPSASRRMLPG